VHTDRRTVVGQVANVVLNFHLRQGAVSNSAPPAIRYLNYASISACIVKEFWRQ
jgi:hypothetical protein